MRHSLSVSHSVHQSGRKYNGQVNVCVCVCVSCIHAHNPYYMNSKEAIKTLFVFKTRQVSKPVFTNHFVNLWLVLLLWTLRFTAEFLFCIEFRKVYWEQLIKKKSYHRCLLIRALSYNSFTFSRVLSCLLMSLISFCFHSSAIFINLLLKLCVNVFLGQTRLEDPAWLSLKLVFGKYQSLVNYQMGSQHTDLHFYL